MLLRALASLNREKVDELQIVDRLGHVARHAPVEARDLVLLLVRGSEHDHRDSSPLVMLLDDTQKLEAVHD